MVCTKEVRNILAVWFCQSLAYSQAQTHTLAATYEPLDMEKVPRSTSEQLPTITEDQVVQRIKNSRKPNSQVPGDIHPSLYGSCAKYVAKPAADIYNAISRTLVWPEAWTREFITVIPKKRNPEGPSDCRNISCTNYLSKIYEAFVLEWAREQVKLNTNQYGGERGCSTSHMIIDVHHEMTAILEDRRAACVLTGIDYSKALNRLAHLPCLRAFKQKGASNEIIQLLASFLSTRTMTVRVGNTSSTPRGINAGAPQGSVLGSFLFNVGIDDLEDECIYPGEQFHDTAEHQDDVNFPAASTPRRVSTANAGPTFSPIRTTTPGGQSIEVMPRTMNTPPWLRGAKEQMWIPREPKNFKYIDDQINLTTINMKSVAAYKEGNKVYKTAHPAKAEAFLHHITNKAREKGMQVNQEKTGLMCITGATSYSPRAEIIGVDKEKIISTKSYKFLGITVDRNASFRTHKENTRKKIRSKTWAQGKLKRAGFSDEDLVWVYKSHIRPTAEYAAVAWHGSISAEQAAVLERQQIQAMKQIFGFQMSAAKMLATAKLETLSTRRLEACKKFATKACESKRFAHWFKRRPEPVRGRRQSTKYNVYEENLARTDRYRNTAVNYLCRLLNEMERKQ